MSRVTVQADGRSDYTAMSSDGPCQLSCNKISEETQKTISSGRPPSPSLPQPLLSDPPPNDLPPTATASSPTLIPSLPQPLLPDEEAALEASALVLIESVLDGAGQPAHVAEEDEEFVGGG